MVSWSEVLRRYDIGLLPLFTNKVLAYLGQPTRMARQDVTLHFGLILLEALVEILVLRYLWKGTTRSKCTPRLAALRQTRCSPVRLVKHGLQVSLLLSRSSRRTAHAAGDQLVVILDSAPVLTRVSCLRRMIASSVLTTVWEANEPRYLSLYIHVTLRSSHMMHGRKLP